MPGTGNGQISTAAHDHVKRIAIVGAGGQIGKHITEQLVKTRKFNITAVTRPGSDSTFADQVTIARVDYTADDISRLVHVLQGNQVLIIATSIRAPQNTLTNLIDAAAEAGVAYIFPNWYGQDPTNDELCYNAPHGRIRDVVCTKIESLGVSSYIQLACNPWYEFSLDGGTDRFGFDFKKRELVLFNDGNTLINTTTWPQCGRAIAALLSLKEYPDSEDDEGPTLSQFRNKPLFVSSFRVSQRDMFESVKRVTGTTDVDWTVTHVPSEQRWREGRDGAQSGDMAAFTRWIYAVLFVPGGGGEYQSVKGLHNEMLGLPVEDLDEYTAIGIRMSESSVFSRYE